MRGRGLHALFPVKTVSIEKAEEKPAKKTKAGAKASAKAADEGPLNDALKARLTELRSGGFNRLYQLRPDLRVFYAGVAAGD